MVELDYYSAEETAKILGVTLNNLRQLQFRKSLVWTKREGRKVYYMTDNVHDYVLVKSQRA